MRATSQTGRHAPRQASTTPAPGHDIAEVHLTRGVWEFQIAGADGAGRPLRGSFAVPIN